MLSFWEKIPTTYGPTSLGWPTRCRDTECERAARWIHRWETETSGSQMDFYCEKHALEHGLSNYDLETYRSPVVKGRFISPSPNIVSKEEHEMLLSYEKQAGELRINYGGHPEDRIFENEAEAREDEKEVE